MNRLINFLLASVLVGCSSKPVPQHDVYEIRKVGMMSTVEYTLGKVLQANDSGEWYKWGDRKLLMSCRATVKAGINFNALRDGDIKINGSEVEITLPAPEIISFSMDPPSVKTEMADVNGFREGFSQQEKNEILRLGEKSIRNDLQKLRVLDDANRNAEKFVRDFYEQLGYETILIHETKAKN